MPADSKSSLQGRINNFQGAPATDPSVVLGNATDPGHWSPYRAHPPFQKTTALTDNKGMKQ